MKILLWSDLDASARAEALARPPQRRDEAMAKAVRRIVIDVRDRGWASLCEHAERIDGEPPRRVSVADGARQARAMLSPAQIEAIELARRNIETFHRGGLPGEYAVETMPGLAVRRIWRPIDRVGLYIPGGKTPLFSTMMMLAIPARAAGVKEIVAVTPPRPEGGIDPLIALAAEMCGIDTVWTVGGAQAIAALALGAGDIPRVDKICGPGNAWVAEAKTFAASLPGGPAIDMPAGPSELFIIADSTADPARIAADLLSQAEHDDAAQVLLATPDAGLAERVAALLCDSEVPRPQARNALAFARLIVTGSIEDAVEAANLHAPEHLALAVAHPERLIPLVRNAGTIFSGHDAAEAFGDYLAGSSHVLPTDGAARAYSGISALSFMKAITVQSVTPQAARTIAAPAALLARMEGLEAHARSAETRGKVAA